MKELIQIIAHALVDNPEKVTVDEVGGSNTLVLELKVAKEITPELAPRVAVTYSSAVGGLDAILDADRKIMADGSLSCQEQRGSIHQIARAIRSGAVNGWKIWYYEAPENGKRQPIDALRQQLRDATEPPSEN